MLRMIDIVLGARATWILILVIAASYLVFSPKALCLTSNLDIVISQPWRLLTYIFVQNSPSHLFFNILVLLIVGCYFEHTTSSATVISVFLAGGVIGGLMYVIAYNMVEEHYGILIGASGAICALTASCVIRSKIKWMLFPLILFLIIDLFSQNPGGSITHIGGFICGVISALSFRQKSPKTDSAILQAQNSGFVSLSDTQRQRLFSSDSRQK